MGFGLQLGLGLGLALDLGLWVGVWARRLLLALDLLLEQLAADLELLVLIVHHLPRALPHRGELLAPAQQLELEVATHLGSAGAGARLQRTGLADSTRCAEGGVVSGAGLCWGGIVRGVG